jgi:hypothetical protein
VCVISWYRQEYPHLKLKILYYKHITIIKDDSSIINKLGASLTDDARAIIYDSRMFIVHGTGIVLSA